MCGCSPSISAATSCHWSGRTCRPWDRPPGPTAPRGASGPRRARNSRSRRWVAPVGIPGASAAGQSRGPDQSPPIVGRPDASDNESPALWGSRQAQLAQHYSQHERLAERLPRPCGPALPPVPVGGLLPQLLEFRRHRVVQIIFVGSSMPLVGSPLGHNGNLHTR